MELLTHALTYFMPMEVFISRGTENFGPYTPDDILAYVKDGSVSLTDLAWHAETTDWIPVSKLPFMPQEPKRNPPPPRKNIVKPPVAEAGTSEISSASRRPPKNLSTFGFTVCWVLALVCLAVFFVTGLLYPDLDMEEMTSWPQLAVYICLPLFLVGVIGTSGLFWQLHFDAWKALPESLRSSSPGLSAWLLFLPVFNVYWIFRAHIHLSRQYRLWAASLPSGPPAEPTKHLGIAIGLLTAVLLLALNMWWSWFLLLPWCAVVTAYYAKLFRQVKALRAIA